jgi:hypothetical protein
MTGYCSTWSRYRAIQSMSACPSAANCADVRSPSGDIDPESDIREPEIRGRRVNALPADAGVAPIGRVDAPRPDGRRTPRPLPLFLSRDDARWYPDLPRRPIALTIE